MDIEDLRLNEPLRWEHEDGATGTEVTLIPKVGEVFFSDHIGPVVRVKHCSRVRWRVIIKVPLFDTAPVPMLRFRVTVVQRWDETFVNAIPWIHPEVIHCTLKADHDGCEPWLCARVLERVNVITQLLYGQIRGAS